MKRKIVVAFLTLACALACAFGFAACDEGRNEPPPWTGKQFVEVTLDKDTLVMKVGENQKLNATVTPSDASDKTVHWRSDADYIVSISDDGEVHANAVGIAKIDAYVVDGGSAHCEVNVVDEPSDFVFELTSDREGYVLKSVKQNTNSQAVIPSTYNGKPVKQIGSAAFEGSALTGVTIPNSVTQIGERAFAGCNSLSDLTIPSSVRYIWSGAFSECTSLSSVIIPDGVEHIDLGVFEGCDGLTSITVPYIGCSSNWGRYFGYIFGADSKDSNGEKVPSSLKTVTITKDTVIPWEAFYNCSSVTKVVIPDSVRDISERAFANCTALCELDIPIGVETIGVRAFENCTSITSVTLPASIASIELSAFEGCSSLTSRRYAGNISGWMTIRGLSNFSFFGNDTKLYIGGEEITGDLILPDGITTIASYAFYGCPLTSVVIPDSVTVIGSSAFANCTELANINIPDGVTDIDWLAFAFCSSLTDMVIPNSVAYIADDIFRDCTSLASLTIPYVGVKHSSNDRYFPEFGYIFDQLNKNLSVPSSLKKVTVTGGEIATRAFANCSHITDIIVTSGVTSIGYNAFSNCNALVNMTLPFVGESAKSAQNKHFGYIFGASMSNYNNTSVPNSLKKVTIAGNATIEDNAFLNCGSLTTAVIGSGVESIGRNAFDGCTSLASVTIGEDVKSIEVFAFRNCAIKDLTMPSNVTSIGQYAFYGNANLKSISLSNAIQSLNNYVFYGCTSLEMITVPSGVKGIGNYAFYGCTSLMSVTIPDSVTVFGDSVFADCIALKVIHFGGKTSRWTSITKPDGWNNNSGNYFVRCTDGEWDKNGNEIIE